jgi:hypothetical protein
MSPDMTATGPHLRGRRQASSCQAAAPAQQESTATGRDSGGQADTWGDADLR